jgi:hypothetical protein
MVNRSFQYGLAFYKDLPMSLDATLSTWKLPKSLVTSTEKLFLLSCADRAGEEGECWPSIRRLAADTCMDRKTIIDVRQSCIQKGLLEYTGEKRGRTKSVEVMRLTYINQRGESSTENGTPSNLSSTENGTAKQYRKRDTESLSNNLPYLKEKNLIKKEKPTPIPTTQSSPKKIEPVEYQTPFEQHLQEQEQKLLAETSHKAPNLPVSKSYYGGAMVDAITDNNPYMIPQQLQNDFRIMREAQRKPITITCWIEILKQMELLAKHGLDPIACFAHYVAAGWASFDHEYFLKNKNKNELDFDSMDWGKNLDDIL